MYREVISSIITLFLLYINLYSQTYDLRFNTINISETNFDVQVQIKSSSSFKLAASNITFNYNTSALSGPSFLSAQNYSGAYGSPLCIYSEMTVTEPNAGIASINITYTFANDTYAADVPTNWTSVCIVRFNILNMSLNPNLVFRNSGMSSTTIYKIAGSSTTLLTAGDLFPNNDPMPVELTNFSIAVINQKIELTWVTQSETNNYGFEIERSSEERNTVNEESWEKVGFVNGNGTSNTKKEYKFIDNTISKTNKYLYRLKQIDNDGKYEYSSELSINFEKAEKFELNQNYPNPFNPITTIEFSTPKATHVDLIVYNILGEMITILEDGFLEAGYYKKELDGSALASGIYIYRLVADGQNITKKMNLTK
jgi:hypothetical protein